MSRAAILGHHELGRMKLFPREVAVGVCRRATGDSGTCIYRIYLLHRRAKAIEPLLMLRSRAVAFLVLAFPGLKLVLAARLAAARSMRPETNPSTPARTPGMQNTSTMHVGQVDIVNYLIGTAYVRAQLIVRTARTTHPCHLLLLGFMWNQTKPSFQPSFW